MPRGTPYDYAADRSEDQARKRQKRAEARTIDVPPCEDPARRARLEADDVEWLLYYFGPDSGLSHEDCFTYRFTGQQLEMIAAVGHCISNGGDKALAASRGEGKTTIAERLAIKYTLQGKLDFTLLCCSTGPMAEHSLETIRDSIEQNDLLAADYPEVCVPVRLLEGVPQRAKTMLANGKRHDTGEAYTAESIRFSWTGNEVVLPDAPGSPSAQAVIATRGLDAAIRGIKRKGKRVKLVLIDDPDTLETACNERQAEKLESRIDKDLAGLGGQRRSVSRVMLTTLQTRTSVSYLFTDQKKSLRGLVLVIDSLFVRLYGRTYGMTMYAEE
jgi:hypothetical protein